MQAKEKKWNSSMLEIILTTLDWCWIRNKNNRCDQQARLNVNNCIWGTGRGYLYK